MARLTVVGLALLAVAAAARAEPKVVLRIATIAPDGTSYARLIRTFQREVHDATAGEVAVKVYFGGIAGDDAQSAERVQRGQLDGVLSAGILCEKQAPSLRALRLVGFYRNRGEADYVTDKLRPIYDEEFRRSGYAFLGAGNLGPSDLFSRRPIRTLADLLRERLWQWDTDSVQRATLQEMGLQLAALPVGEASRAYADGRADGFLSIPSATLAFQWSVQAKYMSALELSYLIGCVVLTHHAFDRLSPAEQQIVRDAGGRLVARISEVTREQDQALFGGLFQHQGLVSVPVSESFRADFFAAAAKARARLGETLIPASLYKKVSELVEEYRKR